MTTPEPTTRVVKYEVSCLPEDSEGFHDYALTVEYRGENKWVLLRNGRYCGRADRRFVHGYVWRDGTQEPTTDEEFAEYRAGLDEWRADHYFVLDEALAMAEERAPQLKNWRGWTVADVLQWEADKRKGNTDAGRVGC